MWWLLVPSLVLLSSSTEAQVPERLLARDAVRYFELTAEQVKALTGIHASWLDYCAKATQRASRIETEIDVKAQGEKYDPVVRSQRYAELDSICEQAVTRRRKSMAESRALLKPAQMTKLAALEQALTLMPIIQSAQSVNLLSGILTGPPAGMPDGTLEVEFSYVRSTVVLLPGCRASPQVVRPGVDLGGRSPG